QSPWLRDGRALPRLRIRRAVSRLRGSVHVPRGRRQARVSSMRPRGAAAAGHLSAVRLAAHPSSRHRHAACGIGGACRGAPRARRTFGYPPFGRLVLLQTAAAKPGTVERRAAMLAERLRAAAGDDAGVLGPAWAFAAKRADRYRMQIVLRGPHPERVLDAVDV